MNSIPAIGYTKNGSIPITNQTIPYIETVAAGGIVYKCYEDLTSVEGWILRVTTTGTEVTTERGKGLWSQRAALSYAPPYG